MSQSGGFRGSMLAGDLRSSSVTGYCVSQHEHVHIMRIRCNSYWSSLWHQTGLFDHYYVGLIRHAIHTVVHEDSNHNVHCSGLLRETSCWLVNPGRYP